MRGIMGHLRRNSLAPVFPVFSFFVTPCRMLRRGTTHLAYDNLHALPPGPDIDDTDLKDLVILGPPPTGRRSYKLQWAFVLGQVLGYLGRIRSSLSVNPKLPGRY